MVLDFVVLVGRIDVGLGVIHYRLLGESATQPAPFSMVERQHDIELLQPRQHLLTVDVEVRRVSNLQEWRLGKVWRQHMPFHHFANQQVGLGI
jgi:hypothetical protein